MRWWCCNRKNKYIKKNKKIYKSKAAFIDSGLLYRYLTLAHLKSGKKKVNIKYLIKILDNKYY